MKKILFAIAGIITFSAAAIPFGLGLDTLLYGLFLFCGTIITITFYKLISTPRKENSTISHEAIAISPPTPSEEIKSSAWKFSTLGENQEEPSLPSFDTQKKKVSENIVGVVSPKPFTIEVVDILETEKEA